MIEVQNMSIFINEKQFFVFVILILNSNILTLWNTNFERDKNSELGLRSIRCNKNRKYISVTKMFTVSHWKSNIFFGILLSNGTQMGTRNTKRGTFNYFELFNFLTHHDTHQLHLVNNFFKVRKRIKLLWK